MFYIFLFICLTIGLPLGKAIGLLDITWNQAFSPVYFVVLLVLCFFLMAVAIVALVGAIV